ncbi:MAG: extracellular solute-binding protein [Clostridia bacterium]|nr:extracellular solute-binding protein [Clostridia bacterium]
MKKLVSLALALIMTLSLTSAFATATEAMGGLEANWWVDLEIPKSELYYNELTITALGSHYNQYSTDFNGGFYFPTIEKMTGVHFDIDWRSDYNSTVVATALAQGVDKLPHMIQASGDYSIAALINEGAIVDLTEYLDLMPNVVEAVGEDRMAIWAEADGGIWTLPDLVNVPGAQSTAVRKDWLDQLGMEVPDTWEEWKAYWYGVRDNDMNGNGDPNDEIPISLEMGDTGERSLHQLLNAFGIAASNDAQFCILPDGTYGMVYDHPNYKAFLEEVRVLHADGILDQEFATRKATDILNLMGGNLVGTVFAYAEQCAVQTETVIANGDEDALYLCVAPIVGPFGDSMLQMREGLSKKWCITVKAEQDGLVEELCKFWNWQYSPEGVTLYNYGIEGYTFDVVDGKNVLRPEVVASGFNVYRTMDLEFAPFGGNWLTDAFMQCVFSGMTVEDLTVPRRSFYDGLRDDGVNIGKYYQMPAVQGTEAYNEYVGELIRGGNGICTYRDQCIAGQITIDEFFAKYEELKGRGLQDVIDQGAAAYAEITK